MTNEQPNDEIDSRLQAAHKRLAETELQRDEALASIGRVVAERSTQASDLEDRVAYLERELAQSPARFVRIGYGRSVNVAQVMYAEPIFGRVPDEITGYHLHMLGGRTVEVTTNLDELRKALRLGGGR